MAKKSKENKIVFGTDVEDFTPPENLNSEKQIKNKKLFWFFTDERFLKISGVLFIITSVFLLFSFIGFFSSWQADQSIVRHISFSRLTEINPQVAKNFMGLLGAWFGYIFIYKGFGIAAIAVVPVLFALGVLLITSVQPIPILKTLKYSLFTGVWLSITLGFFTDNYNPVYAGAFGFFGSKYLVTVAGNLGTLIIITGYALIFLIAVFNIKIYPIKIKQTAPDKNDNTAVLNTDDNLQEIPDEALQPLNPDDFILKKLIRKLQMMKK